MQNALSVDVEEYFQVSAFAASIQRSKWPKFESRVEKSVYKILELFDHHQVRATFFVLGWTAERHPDLIREIHNRGHEIASHGYGHQLIYQLSPQAFRDDIVASKKLLEEIIGDQVIGYRAPSYSITTASLWAFTILREEGFQYDSSIFPIHHDRYGIPESPRFPYRVNGAKDCIMEFPLSTVRVAGQNLPVAGGGYLRLFPYALIRWGIRRINQKEGKPAVVYFHPWEIDPDQPRQPVSLLSRFRHYSNLHGMWDKVTRLLQDFPFVPLREVLETTFRTPVTSGEVISPASMRRER